VVTDRRAGREKDSDRRMGSGEVVRGRELGQRNALPTDAQRPLARDALEHLLLGLSDEEGMGRQQVRGDPQLFRGALSRLRRDVVGQDPEGGGAIARPEGLRKPAIRFSTASLSAAGPGSIRRDTLPKPERIVILSRPGSRPALCSSRLTSKPHFRIASSRAWNP
jgi:hypothetical protein